MHRLCFQALCSININLLFSHGSHISWVTLEKHSTGESFGFSYKEILLSFFPLLFKFLKILKKKSGSLDPSRLDRFMSPDYLKRITTETLHSADPTPFYKFFLYPHYKVQASLTQWHSSLLVLLPTQNFDFAH